MDAMNMDAETWDEIVSMTKALEPPFSSQGKS